ncbi:hypothetical protein G4B88_013687 [Cannabis sativa]|uniref:IST1-like protein n=1 Tax=Cannabis sativa TaxID=3483 RepID=A0A7J6HV54_CANSA|nr:hypothetical protein G4B88_013687 [Cannabis sativa]
MSAIFDFFWGWRKASNKRLIKQLQCRLKVVKNKRHAIVRQSRSDLAQLIKTGHKKNTAFIRRVEQLIKDEAINAAYELLECFCDFILVQFSYIRKTNIKGFCSFGSFRDCPNDIHEAISSLIYASPWCGELPELLLIRRLFAKRYGQNFATAALELSPGNHVNLQVLICLISHNIKILVKKNVMLLKSQVKEKLSTLSISEDMKQKLVNEIVKEYCLTPDILALHYYYDWAEQKMKLTSSEDQALTTNVPTSYHGISEERSELHTSKPLQDLSLSGSSVTSEQKVVPSISESQAEKEDISCGDSLQGKRNLLEMKKEERIVTSSSSSSSESLPKVHDEMLVYMDDIEEFQSSTPNDEDSQDQRLFKFKDSSLNESDQLGNKKVKSSLIDSERSISVSSKKRTRRRLVFHENQTIEDNECLSYYGEQPSNNQRSYHHQQIKQHKKTSADYEGDNRPNQFYNSEMGFTSLSRNRRCYPKRPECCCSCCCCCCCCCNHRTRHSCSSLESPCYFFADDDNDNYEAPSFRKPNNVSRSHYNSREHMFTNGEEELNEEVEIEERPKDISNEDFQGCNTFPIQTPKHVHPKLPDYDVIAAKFMALKREKSCH